MAVSLTPANLVAGFEVGHVLADRFDGSRQAPTGVGSLRARTPKPARRIGVRHVQSGQKVLILGASGGVGSFAVQIAKAAGAEVHGRVLGGFGRSLRAVLVSPLVSQRLSMLASTENADDLRALAALIESSQVTPAVDSSYPLSETAEAIRYVHSGKARGKVVITM